MSENKKTDTYYIACATCYEVKAFNGSISTKDNSVVWFGESEGYPQCFTSKRCAKKFKTIEEIKANATSWDGMPWYFQLKPGTLQIYRVTEEISTSRHEEEVI